MATIVFIVTHPSEHSFVVETPSQASAEVPGYDFSKSLGLPYKGKNGATVVATTFEPKPLT